MDTQKVGRTVKARTRHEALDAARTLAMLIRREHHADKEKEIGVCGPCRCDACEIAGEFLALYDKQA